jgi:hypothetical protein
MNEAQLASSLGLTENDIRTMLNDGRNITVMQLATILIATGNVIEIKPIENTPLAKEFDELKSNPATKVNTPKSAPRRMPNGRFAPKNANAPIPAMPPLPPHMVSDDAFADVDETRNGEDAENVNLDSLTRKELVNIVRDHEWEGEIDLDEADRSQIIDFILWKQNHSSENTAQNEASGLLKSIQDFIAQHPEMRNQIKNRI